MYAVWVDVRGSMLFWPGGCSCMLFGLMLGVVCCFGRMDVDVVNVY